MPTKKDTRAAKPITPNPKFVIVKAMLRSPVWPAESEVKVEYCPADVEVACIMIFITANEKSTENINTNGKIKSIIPICLFRLGLEAFINC